MTRTLIHLATFLSAFLLFVVQPLYAKYLLPYFGGTSSVWTISVFFYSTTLLVGYLYASLLTQWRSRVARFIHTILLVLAGALLLGRWLYTEPPLLVGAIETGSPAVSVLLTLLYGVGLPVLLLASTSVIAQQLYARLTTEEPYKLYALSNAGSLLGLAAYPFLVEPFTTLSFQAVWWVSVFVLFLGLLVTAWRQVDRQVAATRLATVGVEMALQHRWKIVALAAIPTFMLTASTELLSQGIASFPLMWVIPLMLYLLSFMVSFHDREYVLGIRVPTSFLVLVSIVPVFALFPVINTYALTYWLGFGFVTFSFFLICVYFHRRIYDMRPRVDDLGPFYVWMTFGGTLGSGVVGLLLPLVLESQTEVYVAFGAIALYLASQYLRSAKQKIPLMFYRIIGGFGVFGVGLVVLAMVFASGPVASERNFYGTLRVMDTTRSVEGEDVSVRMIVNGATVHGMQARDERYYRDAASYYGPDSGIDIAVRSFSEHGVSPKITVVGLGAGMMNAYCDEAEVISYIEINPVVEVLAREYFTYLDICPAKTTVAIGDGRLLLEAEAIDGDAQYDVIMMDAFTDDAIPSHLLTNEAFQQAYQPLLSDQGIIAFHISNKYLNLFPPIAGLARANGYEAVFVKKGSDPTNELYQSTIWVLVTHPDNVERLLAYEGVKRYTGSEFVWTDDKNSVMSVLSLTGVRSDTE